MPKKIILCADGTGNEGGHTPASNVFKFFNAVDIHRDDQIAFYDNGVGTQRNKYVKGLSGALGFGLGRNVKDLYEYLARHYEPGDKIYLFGFSRGAATIRAFNGFLHWCGLVNGKDTSYLELRAAVDQAMRAYRNRKDHSKLQRELNKIGLERHQELPKVTAICVWDTVVALGLPIRVVPPIGWLFSLINWIFDKTVFPYKFYDYQLSPNVEKAYHALAIDDERKSFRPMLWKESDEIRSGTHVEQVWFSGMHSNVGGGYERAGLANIALDWIMDKLKDELQFKDGVHEEIKANADSTGRMYDSRRGHAVFFRYEPRDMTHLCEEADVKPVVHPTVLERMESRIANYAPGMLPVSFDVDRGDPVQLDHGKWTDLVQQTKKWVGWRKFYYGLLLTLTLGSAGFAGWLWKSGIDGLKAVETPEALGRLNKGLQTVAEFVTPAFMDNFVILSFERIPYIGYALILLVVIYRVGRKQAKKKTIRIAEQVRALVQNR